MSHHISMMINLRLNILRNMFITKEQQRSVLHYEVLVTVGVGSSGDNFKRPSVMGRISLIVSD